MTKRAILIRKLRRSYRNADNGYRVRVSFEDFKMSKLAELTKFYGKGLRGWRYN